MIRAPWWTGLVAEDAQMHSRRSFASKSGFWTGGAEAYEKALREEYDSARKRLQARLDETNDPAERESVKEELKALKADFRKRRKGSGGCIF